jgi:hypothetical protein
MSVNEFKKIECGIVTTIRRPNFDEKGEEGNPAASHGDAGQHQYFARILNRWARQADIAALICRA